VLCTRAGLSCDFTALYTRGRLPVVLPDESNLPQNSLDLGLIRNSTESESPGDLADTFGLDQSSGHYLDASMPTNNNASGQQANGTPQLPLTTERNQLHLQSIDRLGTDSRAQSSRNSPDPSQTDLQGHYVGPSSYVQPPPHTPPLMALLGSSSKA